MKVPTTSAAIRAELLEALRLDLVGPDHGHAFAYELLPDSPRRWCLSGFMMPRGAPEAQRVDVGAADEIDQASTDRHGEEGEPVDRGMARKSSCLRSWGCRY